MRPNLPRRRYPFTGNQQVGFVDFATTTTEEFHQLENEV